MADAVPEGARGEPVPGDDRHDPLPANARRGDRRRERALVRAIPGRAEPCARPADRHRAADPRDRVLSHQGASRPRLRPRRARPFRGDRAADLRGVDEPSRGRTEDRELRPRLRLRHPRDPRRHPRPPDREPPRRRTDPEPGGDRTSSARGSAAGVLDPDQSAPRAARTEPLPTDRSEMPGVPDRRPLRDRPGAQRGARPAAAGGPAEGSAAVAGSSARRATVPSMAAARNSQATG